MAPQIAREFLNIFYECYYPSKMHILWTYCKHNLSYSQTIKLFDEVAFWESVRSILLLDGDVYKVAITLFRARSKTQEISMM